MIAKVTTRGQVSIPSKIRKMHNIEPNSRVEWVTDGNVIKVIPLPRDPIAAFRGKGRKSYTNAKLIKDRQVERKEENKQ